MKAMILAAGLGVRLGAITRKTPKCLLRAGGKSMLEHTVERLKTAGVRSAVVNLHHLADQVREHVRSRNSFGIEIEFSEEPVLLDTGGGLRKAAHFFVKERCFFIHNADVFTDFRIEALRDRQTQSNAVAALAVLPVQTDSCLLIDHEGRLRGMRRVSAGTERIFGAARTLRPVTFACLHAASPEIFQFMPQGGQPFPLFEAYMKALEAGAEIQTVDIGASYWIDVGTPAKLEELVGRLGGRGDD